MTDDLSEALPDWLSVSRETHQKLVALSVRVRHWNSAVNLVSKASAALIWPRHILDSAQLYAMAPPTARRWVDLGSGGGFPGLVVAILSEQANPKLELILVEADQRKSVFLSETVRALGLKAKIFAKRIEQIDPLQADVLSARALAPLDALCGFAHRHMTSTGLALFPKGATYAAEIEQAQKNWAFDFTLNRSKTEPNTIVLAVSGINHVR